MAPLFFVFGVALSGWGAFGGCLVFRKGVATGVPRRLRLLLVSWLVRAANPFHVRALVSALWFVFSPAESTDRLPQLAFNTKMFDAAVKAALTVSSAAKSGAVGHESEEEEEEEEVVDHDAVDEDEDEAFSAPASSRTVVAGAAVEDGFAIPFVVTGVALNGFARYAGMSWCVGTRVCVRRNACSVCECACSVCRRLLVCVR